jgi:spore coat polysaccharide biosynthesis protein SpsF (cytidylyltransferase family)
LETIGGKSVLEIILGRLALVQNASQIVLVTSTNPENDPLEAAANLLGIPVFRGAEKNTLDRFVQAARHFRPDSIVRVTADCPLIDPELIDEGIRAFREKEVDFLGTTQPFTDPHGMQFEITKMEVLEQAWETQRARFENEEAFRAAELNPGDPVTEDPRFKKEYVIHEPNLSYIRITLDYPEDLELLKRVFELLEIKGMRGSREEIFRIFQEHPELLKINEAHNKYLA